MRVLAALLAVSAFASDCSTALVGEDHVDGSIGTSVSTLPLVGVETCQTDGAGYLVRCVVPNSTLTATPFDSAVPVRTVLKRNLAGTCVANKNPRLSLEVSGEPPLSYSFFGTPQVTLRKGDRSPITALFLRDELPAETYGIRMQGCRVTLDISFNEPDVNSRAEAEALIRTLEADRDQKVQIRDRYLQLVRLSTAIEFLRKTGDYLTTELTSAQMTELRAAAINANDALIAYITGCDTGVSATDRANLMELYGHLWVLGDPSKWRRTDGSPKTLADFLGADAQAILSSIQNATRDALSDAGSSLDAEAKVAAVAAERAAARVAQARQQLAGWLR
jgi:hypothetical protein